MDFQSISVPKHNTLWQALSVDAVPWQSSLQRADELPLEILSRLVTPFRIETLIDDTRLASKIADLYGGMDLRPLARLDVESRILDHIFTLRASFGSPANVAGKRILDLACGSAASQFSDSLLDYILKREAFLGKITSATEDNILNLLSAPGPLDSDPRWHPWMCRLIHELGGIPVGLDIRPQGTEPFESVEGNLYDPATLSRFHDLSFDACHCGSFIIHADNFQGNWDEFQQQFKRILRPGALLMSDLIPGYYDLNEGTKT